MIEHRFHPTWRFSLALIATGGALGLAVAMLQDWRSDPGFDLRVSAVVAVVAGAVLVMPGLFVVRWYGKVLIDDAGISARDTLGRWRTVRWDSALTVRRFRLLGLRYVLLSSAGSRWSLWLAGSLEPREALLTALNEAGPRAEAIRAEFASPV